jgi:nitrite reductase (NAD(P)H)
MGVDVASFGDFFADMRPVEGQAQTVARISQGSSGGSTPKEVKQIPENIAQPSVQIAIDDLATSNQRVISKPPASKRRGDKTDEPIKCLIYKDPFGLTYKKYIFTADGKYLLGGQMIGDVDDYVKLVSIVKKKARIYDLGRTFVCWTLNKKIFHRKRSKLLRLSSLSVARKMAQMLETTSMMILKSAVVT